MNPTQTTAPTETEAAPIREITSFDGAVNIITKGAILAEKNARMQDGTTPFTFEEIRMIADSVAFIQDVPYPNTRVTEFNDALITLINACIRGQKYRAFELGSTRLIQEAIEFLTLPQTTEESS